MPLKRPTPRVTPGPEGSSRLRHLGQSRAWHDRVLFERYLDERDAVDREMLVERFLPLARRLARRYQRSSEPFDDLFQVACLGLVKAINGASACSTATRAARADSVGGGADALGSG